MRKEGRGIGNMYNADDADKEEEKATTIKTMQYDKERMKTCITRMSSKTMMTLMKMMGRARRFKKR
jgi:hypothetical protein